MQFLDLFLNIELSAAEKKGKGTTKFWLWQDTYAPYVPTHLHSSAALKYN